MNKIYLKSLGTYCAFNAAFWVLLVTLTGQPFTFSSFMTTMLIAVLFHKLFVWNKKV